MEKPTEKPNYYAIIPAHVRYNKELTLLERLLYGEITSLTNFKGYCWANNNYFAKLYGRSKGTISKSISKLNSLGFLEIEIKSVGKIVDKRLIKIKDMPQINNINNYSHKSLGGVVKNDQDNIKLNKDTLNKKDLIELKEKKEDLFNLFWINYDFKKSKALCYDKFMNLSLEICEKCVLSAKEYSNSITDVKYKKHPTTWLNQKCWDDEIKKTNTRGGFTGGGFTDFVF
jgi:hypothetical protein